GPGPIHAVTRTDFEHAIDYDSVLGCAPLLTDGTLTDPPESVRIEAGYNPASTEDIMIHEFGHVLGIEHGDPPTAYMQPSETVNVTAQPNATERAYPWKTTEFRLYAATDQLPKRDRADTRSQIQHAIDYYERIKDRDANVPSNITVQWADNRSDANVVVTFPDQLPTGNDRGSTLNQYGFDPDGDGAIEYYTNASIALANVDTDAVGWHVGYWFGQALGLETSELPRPLQHADARDRRSDWWTDPP
ncbi:MAG: matrixin, partial [Halorientalis sp.]